MSIDAIKDILSYSLPFTVRTADGSEWEVPHTDFAMLSPDEKTLLVFTSGSHFRILNVASITVIEPKEIGSHPAPQG